MSVTLRKLHHDIRGRMNAIKLCMAALDTPMETSEAMEFLADIEMVCDTMDELVRRLEDQQPPSPDE